MLFVCHMVKMGDWLKHTSVFNSFSHSVTPEQHFVSSQAPQEQYYVSDKQLMRNTMVNIQYLHYFYDIPAQPINAYLNIVLSQEQHCLKRQQELPPGINGTIGAHILQLVTVHSTSLRLRRAVCPVSCCVSRVVLCVPYRAMSPVWCFVSRVVPCVPCRAMCPVLCYVSRVVLCVPCRAVLCLRRAMCPVSCHVSLVVLCLPCRAMCLVPCHVSRVVPCVPCRAGPPSLS